MTPPVQLVYPKRFVDSRGWFSETYNQASFLAAGIDYSFVQDNHSYSSPPFVLRGLHFQTPPKAQAKLVRCIRGRVFDVAVDLRSRSSTYRQWVGTELSAANGRQIFIPPGFAHGFLTLEEDCEIVYKCSETYAPEHEAGIAWDSVGIDWPLPPGVEPVLSDKDKNLIPLTDFESPFDIEGCPLAPLE